jgi:hypothetical protein
MIGKEGGGKQKEERGTEREKRSGNRKEIREQ